MILLFSSLVIFGVLSWATWSWWVPRWVERDTRSFDRYIGDIRAMNEYNGRFLEAIVIFLAIALVSDEPFVHKAGLLMLLAGFVAGATAMIFFPLPRAEDEDRRSPAVTHARQYWVFKIVASQATVVFTVSGVVTIMMEAIFRL